MCEIKHTFTSSPAHAEMTPFLKIHSAKRCVTLIYLRGDGRQRPLQKLTLSEPGCQRCTDAHFAHSLCSWLGCAAQSK